MGIAQSTAASDQATNFFLETFIKCQRMPTFLTYMQRT